MPTMVDLAVSIFLGLATAVLGAPAAPGSYQLCPKVDAFENIQLEQIVGSWRLAYLFVGQSEESLEEDDTCVVVDLIPNNSSKLELALFIDLARDDHIDRSSAQFPASLVSPGEWHVYFPFTSAGVLHAKVLRSSRDHLIVTFCGAIQEEITNNEITGGSSEDTLDWRSIFDISRRRKRYAPHIKSPAEAHLWTAVLVKHNNISALKFVEYASVLMKFELDVTQGELISFGQCPVKPKSIKSFL